MDNGTSLINDSSNYELLRGGPLPRVVTVAAPIRENSAIARNGTGRSECSPPNKYTNT